MEADTVLLDWLREKGCLSVKRGCDTSNCGLCTVFMDNKPILSCSKLAVQADGHEIKTLEGLQEEALEFVGFIADQGADQCGFCNPGFVMNTIALLRENQDPTEKEDVTLPMHVIRKNYFQTFQGIPSSYTAQSILMTISGSWISLNRMEHR